MPDSTYEILDGVRRTKAAHLCGQIAISVQVNGVGPIIDVAIDRLLSPKDEIDVTGVRGLSWGKILRAVQNGVALPPIEITPGSRGVVITDVLVKDELNELRQATK